MKAERIWENLISSNYTFQTAHDQLSLSPVASVLHLTAEAASGKQDVSEIMNLSSIKLQMLRFPREPCVFFCFFGSLEFP